MGAGASIMVLTGVYTSTVVASVRIEATSEYPCHASEATGFGGTPIEVLVRDQQAVAQPGDGTVVLRRWLVTGFGASENWLGDVLAVWGWGT